MENLAGRPLQISDPVIDNELRMARIHRVGVDSTRDNRHYEVEFSIEGRLAGWRFWRAWTYWVAELDEEQMPLQTALILWDDPIGRRDVRAQGYAGGKNPRDFMVIDHYHIDSLAGLRLFADTVGRRRSRSSDTRPNETKP